MSYGFHLSHFWTIFVEFFEKGFLGSKFHFWTHLPEKIGKKPSNRQNRQTSEMRSDCKEPSYAGTS